MRCKLTVEESCIQLEAIMDIDREKFTDELAKEINTFWGGDDERVANHGSHFNAALKLYGQQFFQMVAFNNLLNESWLCSQFDWEQGLGVEGFPSFNEAGITLHHIDTLFIEDTIINIENIDDEEG